MDNNIFSFIVVSYNHAAFIEECLDSIKNQTVGNYEIIVADDLSKDNSVSVFDNWSLKNNIPLVKVYNTENIGLCETLNKCIAIAKGDFIKPVAADDFLHQDYIKIASIAFQDTDVKVIYTNAQTVDEKGKKGQNLINYIPPSGLIFDKLIKGNFIPAPTVTVAKSVYKKYGGYDKDIWIEDWEFLLRISKGVKIKYVNEVLAYYRLHGNNVSSNPSKIFSEWEILMKYENQGENRHGVNTFVMNHFFNNPLFNEIISLYENYKYHNAILLWALKNKFPKNIFIRLNQVFKII